ncbi:MULTISPECIES: hypothetical protein [Paenibacillus]|uniref:Uncharacterized protein n=1 Tax=Paenibacillus odorifer TaxID=189426 RepID=A0ABX3HXC9_9BACL|nr:hypothetical protein [Paenibacillus odorifer]OMD55290.1 hypothetical protein BSK51_04350 [Paenibacillus odorifer]
MQANTDPRYPELMQFMVDTKCGRHFQRAAVNYENLLRDLQDKGLVATFIMELSEYEAEIAAKEAQEELIYQWTLELERELKESA